MNITFYYGSDSFRVREAIDKKIASFLAGNKNGLVEKLDFSAEDGLFPDGEHRLARAENILKTRSFFSEPKLAIFAQAFKEIIRASGIQDALVVGEGEGLSVVFYEYLSAKDLQKKDGPFFKFLIKQAKEVKEFENLRGAALERWALEKITQAGFTIKLPVLKKLVFRIVSQEQLAQEIEKLVAFQSYHQKSEIDDQAVENLVKRLDSAVGNFALIDAIGARDIKKAVILLNQTLTKGVEPQTVFGQIVYQFRNLLRVKSIQEKHKTGLPAEALVEAGLHPFVVRKTSQQVRQFDLEELKNIYRRLAELDIKSKTGQVDLVPALFEFLLMKHVPNKNPVKTG